MSRYSGVKLALRSAWAVLRPRATLESAAAAEDDGPAAASDGLAERLVLEASALPLPREERRGLTEASFVILPAKAVVTENGEERQHKVDPTCSALALTLRPLPTIAWSLRLLPLPLCIPIRLRPPTHSLIIIIILIIILPHTALSTLPLPRILNLSIPIPLLRHLLERKQIPLRRLTGIAAKLDVVVPRYALHVSPGDGGVVFR